MPAPTTVAELLELVQKSGVVEGPRLTAYVDKFREGRSTPEDPAKVAALLVQDGLLTTFQAQQLVLGKWRGFAIGKYKVLERIGSGGMGQVFLAEHKQMRRRVAIKVLPQAKANDRSSLERFQREGRAIAALDHPNLVRAFDIGQDEQDSGDLHYLVMEYIDGASLQEIVKRTGPLDPGRACHYVREAAEGLQYAYEVAGLIHRDIKPANIMVDRRGGVKILDMGLARFFNDEDDNLTRKYDENVLGTADYLSPEQATDSHLVDIRADIYSLGTTFYYLLTGKPPFADGTVAQKLIWHQTRQPTPVRLIRPGVPDGIAAILDRMMMKDAAARYQTPAELAGALAPFVPAVVPPPSEEELPRLSLAATAGASGSPGLTPAGRWPMPPTGNRPAAAATAAAATAAPPSRDVPSTRRNERTPGPQKGGPPPVPTPGITGSNPFAQLFAGSDPAQRVYATAAERAAAENQRQRPPAPVARANNHRPHWWAVAVGVILAVAVLAYLVWRMSAGAAGGPPVVVRPILHRLLVARDSQRGEFRTVAAAIEQARPGDEVVVLDAAHEEPNPLTLDARRGAGVTIRGGNGGQPVTWRLPTDKAAGWLVEIVNCDGPRLIGFVFDGRGAVDTPLRLSGSNPGATIEDVRVQNFRQAGVKLAGCGGEPGRPVTLHRVRVTAEGGNADAGLVVAADIPSRHIAVRDCRFEGPFTAAVAVDGPAEDVVIEHSRLWRAAEGVRCRRDAAGQPLRLTVAGNTFADMRDAVTIGGATADGRVDLRQNLFINCGSALKAETAPSRKVVVADLNARDKATQNGALPAPAHEHVVEFVAADPGRDGFLTYRKENPLAKAGPNGTPIGVPAD